MSKLRLVFAVVLLIHICGSVSTVSAGATLADAELRPTNRSSAKVSPLEYVGVVEDAVKDPHWATSHRVMELVKDAGFNSIRITVPWWQHQDRLTRDYDRMGVCNAARAAEEYGLKLVVTIIGDAGNPPFRPEHYEVFTAFQRDLVNVLLGKAEDLKAKEALCAPNAKELTIEVWNEPNLVMFLRPQRSPDGNRESARIYTAMMARSYVNLKKYAVDLGITINVWGGALASSQDPVNFIREMGRAKKAFKINGRLMDVFTYHPYEDNFDVPPGTKGSRGFSSYANISRAIRENICSCPIVYSEVGWETITPPDKPSMYEDNEAWNIRLITEQKQAEFYRSAFLQTISQGVKGLFIFHLFDERIRPTGFQTGLYYPLNSGLQPKATLGLLSPFLKQLTALPPQDDAKHNPDPPSGAGPGVPLK